eukprot:2790358-Rhodomonas_salina.1
MDEMWYETTGVMPLTNVVGGREYGIRAIGNKGAQGFLSEDVFEVLLEEVNKRLPESKRMHVVRGKRAIPAEATHILLPPGAMYALREGEDRSAKAARMHLTQQEMGERPILLPVVIRGNHWIILA